jgi:type I restriction enzyme M protein
MREELNLDQLATRSLVTRAALWQHRQMPPVASKKSPPNGSALGFEATLWSAAEKLKGNMDAGEYKHVVLGLIFLKYISDAFEERHAALAKDKSADAEDRD